MGATKLPLAPRHPDRICWGCNRYCPAEDMYCGNGTIRAPHPVELFGEDWMAEFMAEPQPATPTSPRTPAPVR